MEYDISVIIPSYNSESTLPETLNCLLGQSLHIEIIVVNDGSVDRTEEIANLYAEKNSNIKVITKENGGVSSARNLGLSIAKGKYVIFLDADDLLEEDSCKNIYEKMESENADMSVFRLMRFGFGGCEYNPICDELSKENDIDLYDQRLLYAFLIGNKCFKRSLLIENNIEFPETRYSEDGVFIFRYIMKTSPKITGVYNAVTKYRRTDPNIRKSVTKSVSEVLVNDFYTSMELIKNEIDLNFEKSKLSNTEKNEYYQEFYAKVCITVANEFYRQLWGFNNNVLNILGEKYLPYYQNLDNDHLSKYKATISDIGEPEFNFTEVLSSPILTVKCNNPSELFLLSLYQQTMCRFELCTSHEFLSEMPLNITKKPKSSMVVTFKGNNSIDPRILRGIVLIKNTHFGFLPSFIIKHIAYFLLRFKG